LTRQQTKKRGDQLVRYVFYLLVSLFACGIGGKLSAEQRPLLPDYEREARVVYRGHCDQGSINYTTYWKQGGYVLEVAVTETKGTFYMLKRYIGGNEGWQHWFFMRSQNTELSEVEHEAWDERVKRVSVNYFNKLHDLETTCSQVLVM